ncbi:hypothetical protein GW17_00059443 [Ensete ventricosum]|nr:hypothetical protein GW17_00059443 [Ensete ventricosum]
MAATESGTHARSRGGRGEDDGGSNGGGVGMEQTHSQLYYYNRPKLLKVASDVDVGHQLMSGLPRSRQRCFFLSRLQFRSAIIKQAAQARLRPLQLHHLSVEKV